MKRRARRVDTKRPAGQQDNLSTTSPTLPLLAVLSSAFLLVAIWAPATTNSLWGLNLWSLWPLPWRFAICVLVLAWIWLLRFWFPTRGTQVIDRVTRFLEGVPGLVVLVALLTVLWIGFRSKTLLFGDAMEVANRIGGQSAVTPRSPLYSFLVRTLGQAAGTKHPDLLAHVIQGISILCGVLVVVLLHQLWVRRYRGMGLVLSGIFLGGYIGLFQGYIECYALIVTSLSAYLAMLLAAPTTWRSIGLVVAQMVAIAAHILGALLLPITVWTLLRPLSKRSRVLVALGILAALAVAVLVRSTGSVYLAWIPPLEFFTRQTGYLTSPPAWAPGLFSVWHVVDIVNGYFLGGAGAMVLGIVTLSIAEGRAAMWRMLHSPLGWAAALFLVARLLIITPLGGPVLDWDLFVVFTIPWAFFLLETWRESALKRKSPEAGRVLVAASIAFVLPLVAMLHSSTASTSRVLAYGVGSPKPRDYVQAQIAHRLGDQAARDGDLEGSGRLFSLAYQLDPNPVYARRAGAAWVRAGNHEEAIRALTSAILADSTDAVSLQERGFIWLNLGKADLAEKDFQALSRIVPESVRALLGLGLAAQLRGDQVSARQHMQEVVTKAQAQLAKQASSSLHNDLGTALVRLGRVEEASREFEMAVTMSPDRTGTWTSLGECYLSLSKFPEARRALEQALELNPRSPTVSRLLGQAYEGEGNNDAALAAYTKALTLKDDPRSRISRGKLLMRMKRVDEAREDASRALVLDPENGEAAAMLSSLGATISP